MKYRNAAERLPPQLLQELQKHAPGEMLYVPKTQRKAWGEGTGARSLYAKRNAEIRGQFRSGQDISTLCDAHFLSDETVRKIIYTKGETTMSTNEFDYSNYFWQNELVRIRHARPDDWKYHDKKIDSDERFYSDGTQEVPTDEAKTRERWENYIKTNEGNDKWICLAVETLDGEFIASGNIHGIDERNGTFGLFVGGEERYAVAALRLMLDYCFNERRLNKCSTYFYEGDTYYMPAFEKLGFKKEGVKRQEIFHKGRYLDEIHYGLLAEEFNKKK